MGAGHIDAVLLDMGGVLIPEPPDYSGAARDPALLAALKRLDVPNGVELALDAGRLVREAYRALQAECTQPDLDAALGHLQPEARHVLLRAFARQAAQPPFSFAREVVERLARRYALGLVSNTVIPGDHHARSLERAGILKHFSAAAWSANFGRRKPDPAIVRHVLGELGVPAQRAVLVGDKLRTDILAADRAQVRSVWIRGEARLDAGPVRPHFVVRDLREVPLLLERLG